MFYFSRLGKCSAPSSCNLKRFRNGRWNDNKHKWCRRTIAAVSAPGLLGNKPGWAAFPGSGDRNL